MIGYTTIEQSKKLIELGIDADSWDEDRWNECSHGIHFFITFYEAVNY